MANKIREIKPYLMQELRYKKYYGTKEEDFITVIPVICRRMLHIFGWNKRQEIEEAIQLCFQLSPKEIEEYMSLGIRGRYTPEQLEKIEKQELLESLGR